MSIGVSFFWVILVGVPLVGGLLLLVSGLRIRRRGQTPYCRNCEYNLTGLTSNRCPECGEEVKPLTIVYGERHRRPLRVVAGVVLLLMVAALMVGAAGNVNWYSLSPTVLLVYQIDSSNPATVSRAWNELELRIKTGRISTAQHARLIDAALKEQGATSKPMRSNLIDYLGDCYFNNRMSQAQQRRFFDQMVVLSLVVRPTVILGDSVPYQVSYRSRSPSSSSGIWFRVDADKYAFLDGQALPDGGVDSYGCGSGSTFGAVNAFLDCKVPGKHTVEFVPEVTVFRGTNFDEKTSIALDRHKVPLGATFEVLASEPPGHIRAIKDPSKADLLKMTITPQKYRWKRSSNAKGETHYELDGRIEFKSPPTDLAFDVFACIEGREYPMGSVYVPCRASTTWAIISGNPLVAEQAAKVDIILRGSKRVAQATVDQFSFWDGELVYKDVPVQRVATDSAPTSAP